MKGNNYWSLYKISGILLVIAVAVACKKYKDPAATNIDDGLDGRRYCNNPLAVNYNWGFPGTPDSTTCIFPVDEFKGTWAFSDSVFNPDGTFAEAMNKTLVWTPTEDTLLTHLEITGWCGADKILVTANKYGLALTDTIVEYTGGGQLVCIATDTISGSFQKYTSSEDSMIINLNVNTASGIKYHKGIAVKQ